MGIVIRETIRENFDISRRPLRRVRGTPPDFSPRIPHIFKFVCQENCVTVAFLRCRHSCHSYYNYNFAANTFGSACKAFETILIIFLLSKETGQYAHVGKCPFPTRANPINDWWNQASGSLAEISGFQAIEASESTMAFKNNRQGAALVSHRFEGRKSILGGSNGRSHSGHRASQNWMRKADFL